MQYLADWLEQENDDIHYRAWLVAKPKAWLLIAHGLAEHSERYERFAQYFNQQNINVLAWDHIGHGEHCEQLGHLDGPFTQMSERIQFILELRESIAPNLKTFLLGHSMGSYIALDYCIRNNPSIDGLILSGSGYNTKPMILAATLINKTLCKIKGKTAKSEFFDELTFSAFNKPFKPNRSAFDWLSSKTEEVDLYLQDPLCGFIPTNGMWSGLLSCLSSLDNQVQNHHFHFPILLQQGEFCCNAHLKGGVDRLKTSLSKQNNQFESLTYPNARHEIFNDVSAQDAMSDLFNWIGNQL
ncbi:hypothetical protein TYM08_P1395 [Marinicellulosiphila megalodicopiae]